MEGGVPYTFLSTIPGFLCGSEVAPICCPRLKPGTSVIRSKAANHSSLKFGLGYLKIYEVISYRIPTVLSKY